MLKLVGRLETEGADFPELLRGAAAEQVLHPEQFTGQYLQGGGDQVFIEAVSPSWFRGNWRIGE